MPNAFLEGARYGRNEPWRWILCAASMLAGSLGLMAILMMAIRASTGASIDDLMQGEVAGAAFSLAAIAVFFPVCLLCVRIFHGRPAKSLLSAKSRPDLNRLASSALTYGGLLLALELPLFLLDPGNYLITYRPESFWPNLLAVQALLPLQVAAEEVVFRAYLLQGFSLATRRPWAGIVLSGALFTALHAGNSELRGYSLWLMLPHYAVFAVALSLVTLADESLEAAIGAHFANNLFSFAVLSLPGSASSGTTVFGTREMNPAISLAQTALTCGAFLLAMLWRRRATIRGRLAKLSGSAAYPGPSPA